MQEGIRINKFLSEAGVCSRREADRRIEAGEILINNRIAVTGDKVMPGDHVIFQGREITKEDEMILLAMNKPEGIVCTAEKREKNNVIDFLHYPKRVYPVGRLDKDSEGLLLLTNNGDIVNKMMRAGNFHEKEYVVTVNRPVSDSFLRGLAGGVPLVELGTTTRKCRVEKISSRQFRIVLTQGLNRQIRRMCEYFGYRVEKLVRVRIMNIELGNLKPGEYRSVTGEEYRELLSLIRDSSNLPASAKVSAHRAERTPADRTNRERRPQREQKEGQRRHGYNKADGRTDRPVK
jgi:23S rRNA pseudouridine2604 synthase